MGEQEPNYYAIIPAEIRYDDDLIPSAKLLYGEITALCNKKGYCWATNEYFAELYRTSEKTISRWVKNLEEKGYISTAIKVFRYNDGTVKKVRYICLDKNGLDHIDENGPSQPDKIVLDHMDKNVQDHPDKKGPYNNKINNTTKNNTTKKKGTRASYGEYNNVLLSDDELEKLKAEYPHDWQKRIEAVSLYCKSTGKKYSDYLATIRNWARRDAEKAKPKDEDRWYHSDEPEDDLPF